MELNPDHPLLAQLKQTFDNNNEDPRVGDFAELLFGQALLVEGSELPDPVRFSRLIAELMSQVSG